MARGKYAARAANRLAEIDSEIVADLREKLAAVTVERDAARRALDELSRNRDASARSVAEKIAAEAMQDLSSQLSAEKQGRQEDRLRYASGVSRIVRQRSVKATASAWADLLDLFNLKGQEIADFVAVPHHPRRAAALTSQELRRADAVAARQRGTSNAVAMRLADDLGATVGLQELFSED